MDSWKKHFKAMAEGKIKNQEFYTVNQKFSGGSGIELVTSNQRAISRAKKTVKRKTINKRQRRRKR